MSLKGVIGGGGTWGSITGTLSDQTDLQAALNAKESALTFSTGLTRSTNTITNNLSTGVAGGQSVIGGTASGDNLTLSSTSHATKGKLLFGTSAYDEVNNRLGVGTNAPSASLDITNNALGTTQVDTAGIELINTTAAASGLQQISPAIRWTGRGWKTNATAASQTVDFRAYVLPVQGSANPTAQWLLQSSINGGAFADRLTVDSGGNTFVSGYMQASTNMFCNGAMYNSSGVSNGNFWSNSASTGTQTNATGIIFGGGSFTSLRTAFNGQTNYSIPVGNSIGNVIIGAMPLTEAASGTHAIIANLAILAPTITNGAGATTDAATLYINGAPSGITPTVGAYSIFADAGMVRIDAETGLGAVPITGAWVNIGAGTTNKAVIKFNSGTKQTSPARDTLEYDGALWHLTSSDSVRRANATWKENEDVPALNSIHVITDYYGTSGSRVLGEPDYWVETIIEVGGSPVTTLVPHYLPA